MEKMNSKFYPKSRICNPKSIPVPRHDFPVSPQRYSIPPPPGCARLGTKIDICEIAIHISRIAAKYIAKIIHIYLIRRHRPGERENQIIFKKRLYRFVVFFFRCVSLLSNQHGSLSLPFIRGKRWLYAGCVLLILCFFFRVCITSVV